MRFWQRLIFHSLVSHQFKVIENSPSKGILVILFEDYRHVV